LTDNQIEDISVLRRVDFKILRSLHLSKNRITDCSCLPKVDFSELKSLFLDHNHICDVSFVGRMVLKKLKLLDLQANHITDMRPLLRSRIFVHVYLIEVEDYFPGCYVPGNGINVEYYDAIREVVDLRDLKYIQTAKNLDWDEIGMKYPREGESEFEN